MANEKSHNPQPGIFSKLFQKYIGSSKLQLLFGLTFLLLLPFLSIFFREYDELVQMRKRGDPAYPWPEYIDILTSVYCVFLFFILRWLIKYLSKPIFMNLVNPKYTGPERAERCERMIVSFLKSSYYVFSTFFAFNIAKNTYFFPTSLGGYGRAELMFTDFPYQSTESFPLIRTYVLMQLGHHLYSLILHVLTKPKSDFMETFLHHAMTVMLVGQAYFMNYVTTTLLVLFTHDFSDIFVHLSRLLVDTKHSNLAFSAYICMLTSWAYLRLYVYPTQIMMYSTHWCPAYHEIYGMGVMGAMLHILLFMHLYWFCLFLKMGYKFVFKSEVEDLQQKIRKD